MSAAGAAAVFGPPASPAAPATITVIGVCGARLPDEASRLLAGARTVAGGARHLAAHAPPGVRRIQLGGDIVAGLEQIAAADGPVAVLASGDPGFFGIARALSRRFGPDRLRVFPAPSSVAGAFARAGVPWDDALVVSAHGRHPQRAINVALAHPKVAVLTEPRFTPADLARALLDGPPRRLLVAVRVGERAERLVEGPPAQIAGQSFAEPNVVLVLDPDAGTAERATAWPARQAPLGWALGEDVFAHRDGMVTKSEVRALALSRLAPGLGDLVWDVGAGSGSVAVECARFGAAAIAVERDAAQCQGIAANAAAHGVSVRVVHGQAPAALAGLPDPDAVFVGGGGPALPAILDAAAARAQRAVVVALAAVDRVTTAAGRLRAAGFEVDGVLLQASRLRDLPGGVHRLSATNPVFVVSGRRP